MQSSELYCEKANNYLNIREKKSNIYFRIVLIVSQRSLRTEFTNMFFSLLLQSKGVFLQLARDRTVCGCGLPYPLSGEDFFLVNITLFGGVTNVTHHVYDSPVRNRGFQPQIIGDLRADFGCFSGQTYEGASGGLGVRRAGSSSCNIFSERLPKSAIIQVLSHPLVLLVIFFRALFIFAPFPV